MGGGAVVLVVVAGKQGRSSARGVCAAPAGRGCALRCACMHACWRWRLSLEFGLILCAEWLPLQGVRQLAALLCSTALTCCWQQLCAVNLWFHLQPPLHLCSLAAQPSSPAQRNKRNSSSRLKEAVSTHIQTVLHMHWQFQPMTGMCASCSTQAVPAQTGCMPPIATIPQRSQLKQFVTVENRCVAPVRPHTWPHPH